MDRSWPASVKAGQFPWFLNLAGIYIMGTCSSYVFIAKKKHHDQRQFVEEWSYFMWQTTVYHSVCQGRYSRHEGRDGDLNRNQCYLLTCCLWLAQTAFFVAVGPVQAGTAHCTMDSHINH